MAQWKLTKEDKERINVLSKEADENAKKVLKKTVEKGTLNFDDMKTIKDNLPPNAPVFAFFSKLTVHADEAGPEYKASAEFRAKTEVLRRRMENVEYKKMVQSVDPGQKYGKVNIMENFGEEMKTVNRQVISVFNVLITVVGAFFFGFSGVTYAYPHLNLDLATRFLIGLVLGTIVFFADLYFVIKSMDEEIADSEKSPFANSHNLNFKDINASAPIKPASPAKTTAPAQPKKTVKSAKAKKND